MRNSGSGGWRGGTAVVMRIPSRPRRLAAPTPTNMDDADDRAGFVSSARRR